MKYPRMLALLIPLHFALSSTPEPKILGAGAVKNGVLKTANRLPKLPQHLSTHAVNPAIRFFQVSFTETKYLYVTFEPTTQHLCYYAPQTPNKFCETFDDKNGFKYRWFFNLEDGEQVYVLELDGDEDFSDYRLYTIDLKALRKKILFSINPIIKGNKALHWGYPWDIRDLVISTDEIPYKVNATLNHTMKIDDDQENPQKARKFPVLFFTGTPTQESDHRSQIAFSHEFYTVKQILRQNKRFQLSPAIR